MYSEANGFDSEEISTLLLPHTASVELTGFTNLPQYIHQKRLSSDKRPHHNDDSVWIPELADGFF